MVKTASAPIKLSVKKLESSRLPMDGVAPIFSMDAPLEGLLLITVTSCP